MKVLIVTETIAGSGHEHAAKSLAKELRNYDEINNVEIVSILQIYNSAVEKALRVLYLIIIKKFPIVWHWMYKQESNFGILFKELISNIMFYKINNYIKKSKPNIIIATHASGLGTLTKLKNNYNYKLAAVFTDYQVNSFWVYDDIDFYFVPHEDFKNTLINKGIKEKKIYISGIPIDSSFSRISSHNSKEGLTIKKDSLNILIMGGGLGIGGIKEVLLLLNEIEDLNISVTVITGINKKLYDEIDSLRSKIKLPINLLYYTDEIYNLMKEANLLISKPGGLTVSEAISLQIPLLIYKAIPGQEECNIDFLIRKKAAIRINNIEEIDYWVHYMIKNPKLYQALKDNQKKIAKPYSTQQIVKTLLNN